MYQTIRCIRLYLDGHKKYQEFYYYGNLCHNNKNIDKYDSTTLLYFSGVLHNSYSRKMHGL